MRQNQKNHRKWPWIVLAGVVIIVIIAAISNGNKKDTPSAATQSVAATAAPAPAAELPATTAEQAATSQQAATEVPAAAEPAAGTSIPFSWSMIGSADQGVATLNTAEWSTTPPEFGSYKNGAGLILDVTVEATEGTVNVNPLYWQARDAEGHVYTYALTTGKDPALASGDINAGTKSRGYVTIDAVPGQVTVELMNPGMDVVASWSVPA